MSNEFSPRLDILPPPQISLWPELGQVPADFALYGGTALALHLGDRESIDFDFFYRRGNRSRPSAEHHTVPARLSGSSKGGEYAGCHC